MAWTLKDRNGNCCGCAQRTDPCTCGTPCAGLAVRTRGGTASLCGYPEYGTPSAPPRFYRRQTRMVSVDEPLWTDGACTVPDLDVAGRIIDLTFSSAVWQVDSNEWALSPDGTEARPNFSYGGGAAQGSGFLGRVLCDGAPRVGFGGGSFNGGFKPIDATWLIRAEILSGSTLAVLAFQQAVVGYPPQRRDTSSAQRVLEWSADCTTLSDTAAPPTSGPDLPALVAGAGPVSGPFCLEGGAVLVVSPLELLRPASGACCLREGAAGRRTSNRTARDQLTLEDTEAAAIARLMSGAGWGPWLFADDDAASAVWVARTGAAFTYRQAEWRASVAGAPGSSVTLRVAFWRRLVGVGAFALFATHEEEVILGPEGVRELTGEVPLERGWETVVQSCYFTTSGGAA